MQSIMIFGFTPEHQVMQLFRYRYILTEWRLIDMTTFVQPVGLVSCSDASTDSEDEPDLEAMTEEERKVYLQKKAERKAAREQRRREKYGDKYEEIMKKHER